MQRKILLLLFSILAWSSFNVCVAVSAEGETIELARYEKEYSNVRLEPVLLAGKTAVAVIFEGTEDLHYYAKAETAPAKGFELKIQGDSNDFDFGKVLYPAWGTFTDPSGKTVEVYAGDFTIFLPIVAVEAPTKRTVIEQGDINVRISGLACTSEVCLQPFEKSISTNVDLGESDSWRQVFPDSYEHNGGMVVEEPGYPIVVALSLAFLAGLSLYIMPCVWPVLPIIVMRIVEQARGGKGKSVAMGAAFCLGILLFFACLAGANIILQVFYGTVLQWGDQFRNPVFVGGMAILLVVLALFMFGVFAITLPAAITSRNETGAGYSGAVGTGFLAAILSTPCSFAILAAAFAWAQAQRLSMGTLAIMVIGVGMAVPYAILTSVPGLLSRLPKAGRWMELFKQAMGFLLLAIAVKLIGALPQTGRMGVLIFSVVLSFSIWMWGSWVSFNTRLVNKVIIRIVAVVFAVVAGFAFLPAQEEGIE